MRFEAASEIGTVRIIVSDDVTLEATNFRRGCGHEIRCYLASKLVHSDRLELGRADARKTFADAAADRFGGANGAVPDLPRALLALDEAVHREAVARRGQRPTDARPRIDADDLELP